MQYGARKKIAFAIIAIMAIANVMAPRLAHASPHGHAAPSHISEVSVDIHRHMPGDDKIIAIGSGEEQSPSQPQSWPDHNCCAASCAPMAHIFDYLSVDVMVMSGRWFTRPLTRLLHPISPPAIERPPRFA